MIDFIEYVVAELKSKRLSKDHAVSLVRQFSRRAPGPATGSVLHPLLHVNTSDLGEQRYSSHFGGDEFFLADHRVRSGEGERRVLPGVAYLEMVRAAMAQAVSERPEATALELRNTVWAQPVIAEGATRVHVALIPGDGDAIDYEIYSGVGEAEIIHGQGVATFAPIDAGDAPSLELDALRARMGRGGLAADALYAHCARMGLLYGPRMRAVTGIERGEDELLARLALPADVESDVYVLHPSLMDGALQAAVGLLDDAGDTPWLPFALDRLRVLAPCVAEMFAWVRYAPGSGAGESVIRLDIDLCDATGAVRAQLRGFSSRALVRGEGPARADAVVAASVAAPSERSSAAPVPVREGLLLASPSWVVEAVADDAEAQAFAGHHVVLCELPNADAAELAATLDGASCTAMPMAGGDIAWRYRALALACFDRIKALLASRPQGRILFRIVVPDDGDGGETALFAGLSGLLRTAALENPQFVGQLIRVPAGIATDALAKLLRRDAGRPDEAEIRYRGDVRAVARWQEIEPATSTVPSAWRDGGVYLITGGLGGLGRLFAQDILGRARGATVVLAGRGALDARREAALRSLSVGDGRACYRPVDLEDAASVDALVASILAEHGRLDGVLHAAGTTADGFLLRKTDDEFARVLGPKVLGTRHLDHATRTVDLDCFVLFSAVAGAMGNLGQADYAAANAFMDAYALHRNALVAAGARRGRTVAIDWPLWQDGGMAVDAAAQERLHAMSGMRPMRGEIGLQAFDRALERARDALQTPEAGRLLAMEGDLARMRATFFGASRETVDADASTDERADTDIPNREDDAVETDAIETAADDLAERTADWLRREFAGLLKLPVESIESRAALEEYGIDSILVMRLTNRLEETFGSLPKTLFFEYQTLHDLAGYFVAQHARALRKLFAGRSVKPAATVVSAPRVAALQASSAPVGRSARRRRRFGGIDEPASLSGSKRDEPIAIVGLSGRYPEAIDIAAFWRNLRDGRDCIVEVPEERWDWRRWYSEDRTASGRHFSKWGGFIAGVDEFDPLFFNISPREAELIDPQERLFLQHAWMAVEDAGYTRDGLRVPEEHDLPGQVGVYVGLMYTEYQLFGPELTARGEPTGIAVSASSIANRVSYALNLHGPSMTVDTMCSSSLTAIHLACQDLQAGRTRFAIAGGVNVSIHPSKYLILSSGQFISSDGHCQSFGEGGDGYIPGEGVGVVVLKRLSDAERDGDRIYGLIRGSALNHGGKTNGYTVPNPQAQAAVIGRALAEAGIDARRIGYVEAHGTGTKLGDPIEIAALGKAFAKYTDATGFCPIGSAKSNIGHCESAAGIAGLTKVLLQLKHRQIVPSLHSARLNPHIDFEKTPFVVNQTLREWPAPEVDGRTWPRLAGLSSFGAGGSNAHLLVEEYVAPETVPVAHAQVAVVLSARTSEQLRQKASDLLAFVGEHPEADLTAMGYTLQVGREAMDERVGWVVSTVSELSARLAAFAADGEALEDGYRGQARRNREALSLFGSDGDLREAVEKWIAGGKLGRLVELWTKGLEVDWRLLYGSGRPRRM
ncbi:MAG: SDR family NAD(P)-dependent oxidoreductase, partial [Pseudomonadota bacterium]